MMNSKKIFFAVSFLLVVLFSTAQQLKDEVKYRTINWGLDQGLSNGGVWCATKDVNGFLWIATPFGLNRFDGGTFKKYIADPTQKNKTIPGNTISDLLEDSLHNIWIGTSKGLSCYDIKADSFRNSFPNLPNKDIGPFWATRNEVFFWDFGEKQWVAYNVHSLLKRTVATFLPDDSVGYGIAPRYAIFDSASNSLWMEKGFRGTGGGLLKVSLANGKREKFDWSCFRNIPNHSHFSEGMRFDRKRNSFWIASPDGLVEFTLTDQKFHHVDALNELEAVEGFWEWAGIDIANDGRIWICTNPAGIVIYDPINNSIEVPFSNEPVQQQNLANGNLFVYCDKEGIVWSGGFSGKGIYQIIPFSPAVKRYTAGSGQPPGLGSNSVILFKNAGQGKLWMGSPKGIVTFNPKTDNFGLIKVTDLSGINSAVSDLLPINIDTVRKKAWLYRGYELPYLQLDIVSGKCNPVVYEDSNGHRVALDSMLAKHPQAKYPIAYKNGLLIAIARPNNQEILEVNNDPVARNILSLPDRTIDLSDLSSMCTNDDDLLFLKRQSGPPNLTYIRQKNKFICIPTPLDSIEWSVINYDKTDQTYWVIAETKLLHYSKNFQLKHGYSNEDGMPGVEVHALITDNKGNVWFTTDRSIFQLNTKTGTITRLAEKDGILPQNFSGPFFGVKDNDGDLYISGGEGFDRISPDKYVFSNSSVYFESLKINQELFSLSSGINNVEELSLKYSENNIVIETGIIDFYSKGDGHIRYKLELNGGKADWQYAPAYYTIRYEQLPPSKYRLVIQSSNAANEFNGPEKILVINISPAFWNTWWFRLIAIAVIAGVFYGLIRWRLQQRFQLQLERTEKEMQIAEIRQKSSELEMQALRAQMNPHFIFNSLNSINRFILQNNRLQASEYLTKFSKLVRMILQNSQSHLITLESELESLGLYLEMEALRFNYHFEYKITYPKDLDIEVLKVPPLILQPYVENAIWHGLMHKEEKGQLNIEVILEDDYIWFKITDDGIGRKRASELASKSATKHKSMGLRITAHRIAMMQQSNGLESPVKISDLEDKDGVATGTEVLIKMPVIYD